MSLQQHPRTKPLNKALDEASEWILECWCWTEVRGRQRDDWTADRRADGSLMMEVAAAVLWRRETKAAKRYFAGRARR